VDAFLEAGFEVIEAEHVEAALRVYHGAPQVHVLFTDVNMPGVLDGIDLAEQLTLIAPRLHIIITSALPIIRHIDHLPATFVRKPYELDAVCLTARNLLAA